MGPLGHIGIATATSIASFVSLYQYIHGLKKRDYWHISKNLKKKMLDIFICTSIMGIIVYITNSYLSNIFTTPNILTLILKLSIIGVIGLATFLISAKIKGVIDITSIIKSIILRRKNI
jgi:peptidoglycan biosynthesis protein MviN/MurJ (putative lipid II flippase)